MTHPRRTRLLALLGLSVTAIAIACSVTTVAPPLTPLTISASDIREHGFNNAAIAAIGEALQGMYGNSLNDYEVFVYVPVKGPRGGATVLLPFTKPCNERFDEQGQEVDDVEPPPPPGSGSGSGGGGTNFPRFPYIPGGCVGNCGTVEVMPPKMPDETMPT